MRVVTNNTPLSSLVLIASEGILPTLFGSLIVPQAVVTELHHPNTPAQIRTWIVSPPPWLDIRQPSLGPDAALLRLHAGEREAILLVQELQADLLLIDDWNGRQAAERRGVSIMGTLRVLEQGAQRGLLDLPTALAQLRATTFYMPEDLVQDMLARDAARKRQGA